MNHMEQRDRIEELESELEQVKRTVTVHWKSRARLMKALASIEEISKLALDFEDDSRTGHYRAHGIQTE